MGNYLEYQVNKPTKEQIRRLMSKHACWGIGSRPDDVLSFAEELLTMAAAPQAHRGTTTPEQVLGFMDAVNKSLVDWLNAFTKDRCGCFFEPATVREWVAQLMEGKPYVPGPGDAELPVVAAAPQAQPELTVWFGSMPESCGRENWTVMLRRKSAPEGADPHERHTLLGGYTVCRSEYKDRMRYEADRLRFLLGEIDKAPWILDYDADLHSGYVAPPAPAAPGEPRTPETDL